MNQFTATRVCLLTPSGRGAVAVVAVAGKQAAAAAGRYFRAANGGALAAQPLARIVYGHWASADGEDLVVCRKTDEQLEIHCHGGSQSSTQIVADLIAAGCELIQADQWLTDQHECQLTAAAHRALAQVTTFRTATILLNQYHGALRLELEGIETELVAGKTTEPQSRLEQLLRYASLGQHLTEPWRVVIAGQPNVGKSSLINALVGYERAIVFDQPGTTRDVVSAITAIEGWPVELSDTAGLRTMDAGVGAVETAGITLARQRLAAADLVVWVLDAVVAAEADCKPWQLAQQQAQTVGVTLDCQLTLLVINKIDLVNLATAEALAQVGTCAVSGAGLQALLAAIAERLVPVVPPPQAAVPFAVEQVAALQAALDAARGNDLQLAITSLRAPYENSNW